MEEDQTKELVIEDFKFEISYEYNLKFKIVIIGDHKVGKTSLIKKAKGELKSFDEYNPTEGINQSYFSAKIKDQIINIRMWDINGGKEFKEPTIILLGNTHLMILVYDITNKESFEDIDYWLELKNKCEEMNNIILVGNKSDMEDKRQVSEEQVKQKYGSNKNITKFFECSALNNHNVETIFKEALKLVYLDYSKNGIGNLVVNYEIFAIDKTSEEKSEDESKSNFCDCFRRCCK